MVLLECKSSQPGIPSKWVRGELGGRPDIRSKKDDKLKVRIKRDYIERTGQFDALFSFNLRTPPSQGTTPSGKRIFALPIAGKQPDALVGFLRDAWQHRLALKQPQ